jgi:SAM-dependent methyltransferase
MALTVGIVVNGLRLRQRLVQVPVLDEDQDRSELGGRADAVFVTGVGVTLDEATRNTAVDLLDREGLDVVDLVPGDLHVEQLLDLVRQVDPATYRDARLAPGRSALHAMAMRPEVFARLGLDHHEGLDVVEMARAAREAKQCAPVSMDFAVAPRLRSVAMTADQRLPYLRALFGSLATTASAVPAVQYAVMAAGLVARPAWGAASIGASSVQPWIVTGGTAVTPADRAPAAALTRWLRLPLDAVRSWRSRWESNVVVAADPRLFERLVPVYRDLLAGGTDRFFEERRDSCPLCGSSDLVCQIEMPDRMQRKPGTFRLDRCEGCGHIFQNPRLSIEGLDFYYRDFYDGLAGDDAEIVFAVTDASYRGRAHMVADADPAPGRWLDVGAGHGHFCLIAAGELPHTQFDGLDVSDSIDDAARRGWVQQGTKGLFPELAEDLRGTYDVVSMNHYLEHTRDPMEELDAARTALRPGGHLLVELPDPACVLAGVLGPYWGPWFQPQHQHFLSRDALHDALEARQFTIVDESAGGAHQPSDLMAAVIQFAERVAPAGAKPWLPEPTTGQRVTRGVVRAAFTPPLLLAMAADQVLAPVFRRMPDGSNAYRVLARRD